MNYNPKLCQDHAVHVHISCRSEYPARFPRENVYSCFISGSNCYLRFLYRGKNEILCADASDKEFTIPMSWIEDYNHISLYK